MAVVRVVVAAGSVPAGRALVRERKAAIARKCDELYVAVSAEITPELQAWITTWKECFTRGVSDVAGCALTRHPDEANARNRRERAYTSSEPQSCQVEITTLSTGGVCFTQFGRRTDCVPRSCGIRVD